MYVKQIFQDTRVLIYIENIGDDEMNIKVSCYQCLWHYDYLDDDIEFYSILDRESNRARQINSGIDVRTVDNYLLSTDNHMVVPTNTTIRLLLTAGDVIHSWWVPELGWKRDAIPGMVNEAWTEINEEGIYRGQCAELCGKDHGFMPIVVEAVSPEDYRKWVEEQKAKKTASTASPAAGTKQTAAVSKPAVAADNS